MPSSERLLPERFPGESEAAGTTDQTPGRYSAAAHAKIAEQAAASPVVRKRPVPGAGTTDQTPGRYSAAAHARIAEQAAASPVVRRRPVPGAKRG